MTRSFEFLLGLPTLRPGPLWSRAVSIGAPVLLSANALSRWRNDGLGLRHWDGFDGRHLGLVSHHKVALDSAGFVAASRYRRLPVVNAALPRPGSRCTLAMVGGVGQGSASVAGWKANGGAQDWCVEPEVAGDEGRRAGPHLRNRPASTWCACAAASAAVLPTASFRFLQGWHPNHYLRCLERMPWVLDSPLVAIGSMYRRHTHGEHGVLHVLDKLDRAFGGSASRWHLFGPKSQAIAVAAQSPPRGQHRQSGLRGGGPTGRPAKPALRRVTQWSQQPWRAGTGSKSPPSAPGRPYRRRGPMRRPPGCTEG